MAPISSKLDNKSGRNRFEQKQMEIPIVKKGSPLFQKNHYLENKRNDSNSNTIIDRIIKEYLQKTKVLAKDSIPFIPEAGLTIKPRCYESIDHFYRETIKMYPAYIISLMKLYDNEQHRNTSDTRHLKRLMLFVIRKYFCPNLSIPLHNKCKIISNTNELVPIEDPRLKPLPEASWKPKDCEIVPNSQWMEKLG